MTLERTSDVLRYGGKVGEISVDVFFGQRVIAAATTGKLSVAYKLPSEQGVRACVIGYEHDAPRPFLFVYGDLNLSTINPSLSNHYSCIPDRAQVCALMYQEDRAAQKPEVDYSALQDAQLVEKVLAHPVSSDHLFVAEIADLVTQAGQVIFQKSTQTLPYAQSLVLIAKPSAAMIKRRFSRVCS